MLSFSVRFDFNQVQFRKEIKVNYYYDIILNFTKDNLAFYEWDQTDRLVYLDKIPIFKVDSGDLLVFVQSNFKVTIDFLKSIAAKTVVNHKRTSREIVYAVIFTDGKSTIAWQFNSQGKSIAHSQLLPEDDLNVLEISSGLKRKLISYIKLNALKSEPDLREVKKIKQVIKTELHKLYQTQNQAQMSFLFLEWFNEFEPDLEVMYHKMLKALASDLDLKQEKIYRLIKLASTKV